MGFRSTLSIVLCSLTIAAAIAAESVVVDLTLDPLEATVGDHLAVRLDVELSSDIRLDPEPIGPEIGSFSVVSGSWSGPEIREGRSQWSWAGEVVTFRTGEHEFPAIGIRVENADGEVSTVETSPLQVSISTVLAAEEVDEESPPIADIKAPVGVPADYGALTLAATILFVLLLLAALLWWLNRRYGARLSAVPAPDDPFRRIPPHVWVYGELQKLLERRLEEQGQVPLFFEELSRIMKRYLSGRYRVELMEQTTEEIAPRMAQAQAPEEAVEALTALLTRCDLVKFAGHVPESDACRAAVEQAYRIVDMTKPEAPAQAEQRGAA